SISRTSLDRGRWKLHSDCLCMDSHGSDDGAGSAAEGMLALTMAFSRRGLSLRHFPHSKYANLVWQAGRDVIELITLPDGTTRLVERFELYCWASTSCELINQLA